MKKYLCILALLTAQAGSLFAQSSRPAAAARGASYGITGGTVAVGIGVVAAIAAAALIANNSSETAAAHTH